MKRPFYNAIHSLFHDPWHIIFALLGRMPYLIPDDAKYLKVMYWLQFREKLNIEHPKKFSEKIQWLKLYNRNPLYTSLVDKYAVKRYVSQKIGGEYVIPVIAVWDNPEQIEWEKLPNQFVLKTNHDGGGHGIVICKEKSKLSISKAMHELNHSFSRSSYMIGREWPYKNVRKKIFAEQYIVDSKGELRDYKFFCFNGKVKCFKIDFNRQTYHQANYYDPQCNLLPYGESAYPYNPDAEIHIPENIKEMISLAEKLAKDIPFVRIDFYNVDGRIYFGEVTFFPAGGMSRWDGDVDVDSLWGSWLTLPRNI